MHRAAVTRPACDQQLPIAWPARDGVMHDARRCTSGAHVMHEEGRRRKRRWRGRDPIEF
ncbi:hypothetical protein F511_47209 [Dorcoceras hygrometricum]|uniref:Uncharacterized protein n=1 Tax=Dorcoceras hygrometricum TaxID=472368 RepID=A0A2Z6ZRJ9_9LAMI|nr:hypothetical protein F511_47209 [Dorcoceras hygrometricum]